MVEMKDVDNVSEDSKNICSDCGSENTDTAKFCVECGQNFQIYKENEWVCNNCGTTNKKGIKFCPECGQNNLQTAPNTGNNSSGGLIDLIPRKQSVTERKGLFGKIVKDAGKVANKAKNDISKSIEDYTLDIETEVNETEDSFIVSIELPNIKKEDIDINITPSKINLKAKFDHEVEIQQGTQIVRKEMRSGSLNKDIILPKEIIPEKTETEFNNDLLIFKLLKADLVQGHKVKL